MYINTTGIILRETAYKESSKILTVLTGGEGKITVNARGALRRNSKFTAVTQLLVFSEMTLFSSRDRWTLTEARSIEQFSGLRGDVALLALGSYFAELAEAASDEDSPSVQLLPLCLNSLFALSEGIKPPAYVKAAFELRLMAILGFTPLLSHCAACGSDAVERAFLDFSGGVVYCADCARAEAAFPGDGGAGVVRDGAGVVRDGAAVVGEGAVAGSKAVFGSSIALGSGAVLGSGALNAARYVIGCEPKKLLSFSVSDAALRELGAASEGYLLAQLDRRFRTLDYLHKMSF